MGGFQPTENPGGADPGGPAAGWAWVTGEPFGFTNWASGEPNDGTAATEDIMLFWFPNGSGKWNDGTRFPLGSPFLDGYVVEFSCDDDDGDDDDDDDDDDGDDDDDDDGDDDDDDD